MEFFPRHYSIPRDGSVTSIVVSDANDLRRLRTELEILRRARRQIEFRCMPVGQAAFGMYSDADQEELETILHDAQHPLVEEMIGHIDRAFPNTRKEIMMSVVNDEAQNIVQEAVEVGAIEENQSSAEAAIDALAEAEAKLAKLVEDDASDIQVETMTDDVDATAEFEDNHQAVANPSVDDVAPVAADEATPDEDTQSDTAQQDVEQGCGVQNEDTVEDAQALHDMEDAVEALTETPDVEPAPESPAPVDEQPSVASVDVDDTAQPVSPASEPVTQDDAPVGLTDNDSPIDTESSNGEVLPEVAPETGPSDTLPQNVDGDAFQQVEEEVEDTRTTSNSTSEAPTSDYGPERAQQAVEEIETGIRKLANVLNTQVKDQWSQASQAIDDIVEKRSQLEQKLFDAKTMLETLDRSRKEAAISRDAADVARREAELFRDDLRKLRDDASAGK